MSTSESKGGPSERLEIRVPREFYRVRFWVIAYLIWSLTTAVVAFGQAIPDLGWRRLLEAQSAQVWIVLGVFVLQTAVLVLGWALWDRVRGAGFWVMFAFWHVALVSRLGQALIGILHGSNEDIGRGLFYSIFIFLVFMVLLWSRDLKNFFRRVNGRCPNCGGAKAPYPGKRSTWTCPACSASIYWDPVREAAER